MRSKQWDQISDEAKEVCLQMMVSEPDSRLTADEALAHPWLRVSTLNRCIDIVVDNTILLNSQKRLIEKQGNQIEIKCVIFWMRVNVKTKSE